MKTTFWIDEETREKAKELQEHYGHSLSGLIRWLIKRAYADLKK